MKGRRLHPLLFILVNACVSNQSPYLDDNLSDRINIANAHFVIERPVYFDTSKFEYVATKETNQTKELHEVQGGTAAALAELLLLKSEAGGNIAVSGMDSKHAASIILESVATIEDSKLSKINLLYIGTKIQFEKLYDSIGNKLNLSFEKKPITAPWDNENN